jgi:hypothetical protein
MVLEVGGLVASVYNRVFENQHPPPNVLQSYIGVQDFLECIVQRRSSGKSVQVMKTP